MIMKLENNKLFMIDFCKKLLSFILIFVHLSACSSTGSYVGGADFLENDSISARGAIGERLDTGALYTGDGGKNIRLAVIAPTTQGEVPPYLPLYIQGLLNNNIGKYSAINLIDRQNLNEIIDEQKIASSGYFSETDYVNIGRLTNTQYSLFGTIQKLSGERYALQLSVTDLTEGVRRATTIKEGALSQIEGSGILINQATAELLTQMGVQLTDAGRQTLLAGNTSVVRAETGLARGITAQAGGQAIEALFSFTQAATFDPSKLEALSRLSTISSAISGGTISERIVNDIQARNRWIEVFRETTNFYNDHPPFEIIFDPNLIQIGDTDYRKNTANLGMRIALESSQAGFSALNALLEGLEGTGKRGTWRFSGWPLVDTDNSPNTKGTIVFGGKKSFDYKVGVVLVNERNKIVSKNSITMTANLKPFVAGNINIAKPDDVFEIVNFKNVKADDLTPTLTIMITAVNGIPSQKLRETGYMRIVTGNLERAHASADAKVLEADQQIQIAVAEKQRQARIDKETRRAKAEVRRADAKAAFWSILGSLVVLGVAGWGIYAAIAE